MGPLHGWAAWVLRVRRDQACGLSSSLSLPPGSHRTKYHLLQERLVPPPCHRSHTLLGSSQGTRENHAWSPSPRVPAFPLPHEGTQSRGHGANQHLPSLGLTDKP